MACDQFKYEKCLFNIYRGTVEDLVLLKARIINFKCFSSNHLLKVNTQVFKYIFENVSFIDALYLNKQTFAFENYKHYAIWAKIYCNQHKKLCIYRIYSYNEFLRPIFHLKTRGRSLHEACFEYVKAYLVSRTNLAQTLIFSLIPKQRLS